MVAPYAALVRAAGCAVEGVSLQTDPDGFARLQLTCRAIGEEQSTKALTLALEGYPECPLESVWLPGRRVIYVSGAPEVVNKDFPALIQLGTRAVIRCNTAELQFGRHR
jgi:hypothetical protein